MSKTRIEKRINDAFSDAVHRWSYKEFGLDIDVSFNIFTGCLNSKRKDNKPFTKIQHRYLKYFEAGYIAAKEIAEGV